MNTDLKMVLVLVFVVLASWLLGFASGRVFEVRNIQRKMRKRFVDFADEMHQETLRVVSKTGHNDG